jgi:hypothetical protein
MAGRPGGRDTALEPAARSPDPDPQVDVGVAQADIAGLIQSGLVVVGQPGQAGHGQVVVVLLHGEGHGPLDQPLHSCAGGSRWGRRREDMSGTLPAWAKGCEGRP